MGPGTLGELPSALSDRRSDAFHGRPDVPPNWRLRRTDRSVAHPGTRALGIQARRIPVTVSTRHEQHPPFAHRPMRLRPVRLDPRRSIAKPDAHGFEEGGESAGSSGAQAHFSGRRSACSREGPFGRVLPSRGCHRRASRIRLKGVSAARRKCVNPALRNTSARRASPACAPRTSLPPSEIECAQQIVVDAA
jgi:hypothetical protein